MWLNRRVAAQGPCLALVLSQEEFDKALKQCRVPIGKPWIKNSQSNATAHYLTASDGAPVCVVALAGWEGRQPVEVAGLLIHEAVHVWQEHCRRIGEVEPGLEQEAYGIQLIAQELLAEFSRRMAA